MNTRQYKKIVKEISMTQAVPAGTVDDIISQYFDLALELAIKTEHGAPVDK